jgi:serine/threonine protein kinase
MQEFPSVSVAGLSLLNQLLTYDPGKRLSARGALRHAYFREQPLPKSPGHMPTFPSAHDAQPDARAQGWRSRRCRLASLLLRCPVTRPFLAFFGCRAMAGNR